MPITITYTFAPNTIIASAQVNTNFNNVKTTYDAHEAASAGVHGVVGDVVGTTDTQTLTNKTLTSPIITAINAGSGLTITAGSAVDTVLTLAPYTSGDSFKIDVPATGNRATFFLNTTAYIDIQATEVVVNEDAVSTVDFRVEGDTNPNLIKTKAATDELLLGGTTTIETGAKVKAQTATDTTFEIAAATSGNGIKWDTPATGNRTTALMGTLALVDYRYISGTEGSIVFNEDSNDVDIRMETNGNANAFVLDGGADTLSIGVSLGADLTAGSGFDFIVTGTGQVRNSGGTYYALDGNGDFGLRSGSMQFSTTSGSDISILEISGVNSGAGLMHGIRFTTTSGTLDGSPLYFDTAYFDSTAPAVPANAGGRIPISLNGTVRYLYWFT